MIRYHVFAGAHYYPSGGMADYIGSFNSLDSAKEAVESNDDFGWADVMRINAGELVWVLRFEGYWIEVPACSGCGRRSLELGYDADGNLVCDDCYDGE